MNAYIRHVNGINFFSCEATYVHCLRQTSWEIMYIYISNEPYLPGATPRLWENQKVNVTRPLPDRFPPEAIFISGRGRMRGALARPPNAQKIRVLSPTTHSTYRSVGVGERAEMKNRGLSLGKRSVKLRSKGINLNMRKITRFQTGRRSNK